jgi:hypothetical protein
MNLVTTNPAESLLLLFTGKGTVEVIQRLQLCRLVHEDPAAEKVREGLGELVVGVRACWDGDCMMERHK